MNPRLADSDPAEDNGLLRAIKIHNTVSFGRESKAVGHRL
jgi:hypothetical protein